MIDSELFKSDLDQIHIISKVLLNYITHILVACYDSCLTIWKRVLDFEIIGG